MGNLNEIQKQTTQSYGDNSFTTTIKENTVEFDSAKDSFTFNDEVNVPSLKVNGQEITPSESQVQADWNQNDSEAVDYIKNKPTIPSTQSQSDWNQTTSTESDYIKNKPTIKAGQGEGSIVEGNLAGNSSMGKYSHAEGYQTTASGYYGSHTEGRGTTASGENSHAEGRDTTASGQHSHAEGYQTTASGYYGSHAEGYQTTASGNYGSHAEGYNTIANHKSQHVFGDYNIADPSPNNPGARGNYVEIVGNGATSSARSNARTLDWSGNEMLTGTLTIGGASGATLKVESGALKVSFDGGATWLTVSAS